MLIRSLSVMYLCTVVSCGMMFFQGFEASFEAFEPEAFSTSNGKCFSVNAAPRRLWGQFMGTHENDTPKSKALQQNDTQKTGLSKKNTASILHLFGSHLPCIISPNVTTAIGLDVKWFWKKLITNLPLLTCHGMDDLVVPLFSEMLKCMRSGFAPWTSWSTISKEPWWTGPATASWKALTES